jgi:hypothetical protein
MRVEQAAQVMPSMAISRVCGGTLKPACSIAETTCRGRRLGRVISISACSLARLTLAATPGNRFSTFSMRAAHAAQVMPLIGRSRRSGAVVALIFAHLGAERGAGTGGGDRWPSGASLMEKYLARKTGDADQSPDAKAENDQARAVRRTPAGEGSP